MEYIQIQNKTLKKRLHQHPNIEALQLLDPEWTTVSKNDEAVDTPCEGCWFFFSKYSNLLYFDAIGTWGNRPNKYGGGSNLELQKSLRENARYNGTLNFDRLI